MFPRSPPRSNRHRDRPHLGRRQRQHRGRHRRPDLSRRRHHHDRRDLQRDHDHSRHRHRRRHRRRPTTDTDTDTDSTTACQPTPWYPDLDDDSYGDPAGEILACEAPPGTIEQGGDCDDQDPDRSPGAGELCDDIDNDCDGYVDEYAATNTSCGGCLMAELGGSVYHRCPALMTWQAARAACQQRYADLLVLEQLDEHDLLLQQLDVPGGLRWWIGLHDLDLEGAHTWVDGAPLAQSTANWDVGQPDNYNGNEDCVELQVEGEWNDLRCDIKRGFVCEGPPVGR
jgi:hypothetical protein